MECIKSNKDIKKLQLLIINDDNQSDGEKKNIAYLPGVSVIFI